MGIVKIPRMKKEEFDRVISRGFLSRIAFKGDDHPYIAPFLYVFDGKYMYFMPTRYGKKIRFFKNNPRVVVEVESYFEDMSHYSFVSLFGRREEVTDSVEKEGVREMFIQMIRDRGLSKNVLAALGQSPEESLEAIKDDEKTFVWKLVDVKRITALKNEN